MVLSQRMLIIQSFIDAPPETEYQRGYLCCLMDEAVQDISDAGTDTFDQALEKLFRSSPAYHTWVVQRKQTLGLV